MRKSSSILAIAVFIALVFAAGSLLAGPITYLPWQDNFENYNIGTPLIDGTNGWYGSSSNIIVQTNTVRIGTNAAMIPVDCSLSNQFQDDIVITNVFLQMDLMPSFYDGTNLPVVDTNAVLMFYVDSNGHFVVHNGPAPDPYASTNWMVITDFTLSASNWVSMEIRVNYATHTWSMFTNRTQIVGNIGFINSALTNFAGLDIYSGQSTAYLDSVSADRPSATNFYLDVTPTNVTLEVMRNQAIGTTLVISNLDADNYIYWTLSSADAWMQISGPTNGAIEPGGTTNLTQTELTVILAGGTYTGQVIVAATNTDVFLEPETAVVPFVLQVKELQRSPAQLTNAVMQGDWVTGGSFQVWNSGPGVLIYTNSSDPWLMLSQPGGTLTGQTDTISVFCTNTETLPVGIHYGTVTISAGGASLTLQVELTVRAVPMLNASPVFLTNTVMAGQNGTNRRLRVFNSSADYGIGYRVTTNGSWMTVSVTNTWLAPLKTNTLEIQYTAVSNLQSAGDAPSNYSGAITITATNRAGGSPLIVPVTVQVNPKPRMALSTTILSSSVLQGRDAANQRFDIFNANGYYTLNYTISNNLPWLLTVPTSGTITGQPAQIAVLYSTRNLAPGSTSNVITIVGQATDGINWASASNAIQQITIALTVTPPATLKTDAKLSYTNDVRKGVTPPNTVFHVWNSSDQPAAMSYTVSPSAGWLTAMPPSGTTTGDERDRISILCDTTGMIPGMVYHGTVQISAIDAESGETAYDSPQMFTIYAVRREFKGFDFHGGFSAASDLVVYREASGTWVIRNLLSEYATNLVFGGVGYQPVPADYSGDGITELGVYRRSSGGWYAFQIGASVQTAEIRDWIGNGYFGVQGDYDGDGMIDPCVYLEQTGLWMALMSASGYQQVSGIPFGGPGYSALPAGDYDGDVKADLGVYHRTSGLWMVLLSASDYSIMSGMFGGTGFVPVPTDFDGDHLMDPAVYETATGRWFILLSTTLTERGYGLSIYQFGGTALSPTLIPAPGDYDGVGGADLALYDTNTGNWFIITLGGVPLAWGYPMGGNGYVPVAP